MIIPRLVNGKYPWLVTTLVVGLELLQSPKNPYINHDLIPYKTIIFTINHQLLPSTTSQSPIINHGL